MTSSLTSCLRLTTVSLFTLVVPVAMTSLAFADAVPSTIGDPTAGWVTSTDFMHARYYSPNLGRFVSVDPVGGSIGSSQSWNRYSYVLNNPVALVDPNGKFAVTGTLAAIGGAKLAWAAGASLAATTAAYLASEDPNNPGQSRATTLQIAGAEAIDGARNLIGGLFKENTSDADGGDSKSGEQERDKGEGRIKTLDDALNQEEGVTGYSEDRGKDEADPEAGYREVDTTKSQDRTKHELKDLAGLSPQEVNELLND